MIGPLSSSNAAFSTITDNYWTGWIVPRIMPPACSNKQAVETAQSINSATSLHSIDPALLRPGRGSAFHPFAGAASEIMPPHQNPDENQNTNDAIDAAATIDDTSESTRLDVFVRPPSNKNSSSSRNDVLHVRLDRSSHELVGKTLQRMVLSLDKQLSKILTPLNQKGKKGKPKPSAVHQHSNNSKNNQATIWKQAPHVQQVSNDSTATTTGPPQLQPFKVDHCTNLQVWKHAMTHPLVVRVELDLSSASNSTTATTATTTISLQVDACPPTIVAVEIFEDFSARVFCGVPLVVQAKTLFPTDTVIIDWYLMKSTDTDDDEVQCVCSNSPSYTPLASDIGKHVCVMITPIRKKRKQATNTSDTTIIHNGRGYEEAYRFQNPIEALPENTILNLRQGNVWTNPNRRCPQSFTTLLQQQPLRVLTYNILADQNAYARTPGNKNNNKQEPCYPYVDLAVLDKARRMPLLLHEILSYQADIICLQEVDESVWDRLLGPVLQVYGNYQGYFSSKRAEGMHEGCAVLWSLHRFESVPPDERQQFELSELVLDLAHAANNNDSRNINLDQWKSAIPIGHVLRDKPDLKRVIDDKLGHIVQMVSLKLKKNPQNNKEKQEYTTVPDRILVGNTHLFYHPLGAHIRLMQMYAICHKFEEFQRNQQQQQQQQQQLILQDPTQTAKVAYPMILCGDMNSSLRRAAGYLLINRQVQSDHTQIREHFNRFQLLKNRKRDQTAATVGGPPPGMLQQQQQPKPQPTSSNTVRVEHTEQDQDHAEWEDFPAIQLPDHFPTFLTGYPTEPAFTHYLDEFVGSLDHIFISQCSEHNPYGLASLRSAPMPTEADVTEHVAMPSEKLPSDHVSLIADLTFTKCS